MKYATGEDVELWDRVLVWDRSPGFIVFSIDSGAYSPRYQLISMLERT